MKYGLLLILSLIMVFNLSGQGGAEAKKLLEDASFKMKSYNNIYIAFDYVLENKEADVEQLFEGDVILQGENYVVNLFDTQIIYDGEYSYTIVPENEEVNIATLNEENKEGISPSSLLTFYENGYTFYKGNLEKIKGRQIQYVNLIPIDSNSEVISVEVGVDKKDSHIYSVREIGKNDTHTIITVNELKVNQKLNENTFTFDEKKYLEENYIINR